MKDLVHTFFAIEDNWAVIHDEWIQNDRRHRCVATSASHYESSCPTTAWWHMSGNNNDNHHYHWWAIKRIMIIIGREKQHKRSPFISGPSSLKRWCSQLNSDPIQLTQGNRFLLKAPFFHYIWVPRFCFCSYYSLSWCIIFSLPGHWEKRKISRNFSYIHSLWMNEWMIIE